MTTPQQIKELGNEKFKAGQYELAATLYSQAIDMATTPDPVFYSNRSNAFFQLGEFEKARLDAQKSLQIDPTFYKGFWRLAEVSRCTTKQKEALDHYISAHKLKPDMKMIADQIKNMQAIVQATQKPKVNFFDAIRDIPCRSFAPPPGAQGQQQMNPNMMYPGMNNMFSNPFGTAGTAPPTVDEKGRDFSVPENLSELTTSEKRQFLNNLFDYLTKPNHLHSDNLFKLIKQGGLLLSESPIIQRSVLKKDENMFIIGDIHGSLNDLKAIFGDSNKIGLDRICNTNDRITILGDYVDRGTSGHHVITLAVALKVCFPDRVTLLRGNHETTQMNNFFGYQSQVENAYGSKSPAFNMMTNLFAELPLIHIFTDETNNFNYFCCHGGPPIQSNVQSFDDLCNLQILKAIEPQDPISQQLLWSDPNHEGGSGLNPSHRGVGFIYGNNVFEDFRKKTNLHRVFRAHEVVFDQTGVRDDFNTGNHFTVFSSSQYMGQNNVGGIVKLTGGVDDIQKIQLQ